MSKAAGWLINEKLESAAKIAALDPEKIDFALLVGGLANLKEWAEKEPHIIALGKRSMCGEWRNNGQVLLSDAQTK